MFIMINLQELIMYDIYIYKRQEEMLLEEAS